MAYALAALTAVFFGLNAYPARTLGRRGRRAPEVAWMNFTISAPILFMVALAWGNWRFQPGFFSGLAAGVAGNMIAYTLYFRAIRDTDLSIALPLVSLSPLFMLFTSRWMLGEEMTSTGTAGVVCVAIGAYLLGCARDRSDLAAPFRALWRDKGARSALAVSVVWSITSNIDKYCVRLSDPFTYSAIFALCSSVIYLPLLYCVKPSRDAPALRHDAGIAVALGISSALMVLCQMSAILLIPVPYVIAIKRAGMLIGIADAVYRRESGLAWRLAGSLLILAGIGLIVAGPVPGSASPSTTSGVHGGGEPPSQPPQTNSAGVASRGKLLRGQWETHDLDSKDYVIHQNEWSGDFGQQMEVEGSIFRIVAGDFNMPVAGPPATYPSIFKGCHWGNCTSNSGMPIQVGRIGSATSSWRATPAPGAWNMAYDIWFNTTPTPRGKAQPDRAELMIWLAASGGVKPAGTRVGTVILSGMNWDIWLYTGFQWKLVSYSASVPVTEVSNLDIKAFADDMVSRGYLNRTDYMIAIEAGFEIWNGGIGLSSDTFVAAVQPTAETGK
ncbi:MAG: EamA family transporter [Candidatus Hydrogenedentota bacterium]